MKHAFPEDELRPISCGPLTRDRDNSAHIELNDALGNYSLTLIDSLSTLAILASSHDGKKGGIRALGDFQDGVKSIIDYYGDGTDGPSAMGIRAKGFDLDSKVQVFETVIRGVGGLLSAHLFAQGDLPIRAYRPVVKTKHGKTGISWRNGLVYDGQLLRLATDLARRLLPAFDTETRLPYPRVNLRTGVSFYARSSNHDDTPSERISSPQCADAEVTETCSAGAGSLILEFTTLSRLTGDSRFEEVAKDAFWAVWHRRSTIGLVGSGIDAETGRWESPSTGVGAGIDSFFEYAFKSHILLSGLPYDEDREDSQSPDAFLEAWQGAHAAIKRHVYRSEMYHHPHYLQVDLYTGALRAFWLDSLSAYYQGLLTLAGEFEEAQATHLLYTALWTRYSALPERWSTMSGNIESGLRWWGGRPEFIESTWYLYRATKDPWYLHVGEMALRDIKRRCWTRCGWAGLQDVRTGEKMDRMESFFLGETVKYLYLLFDPDHPLNHLDSNWVFTTEGHPLVVPKRFWNSTGYNKSGHRAEAVQRTKATNHEVCPLPPQPVPLTFSATAARGDLWHAAYLARLHLMPTIETLESPLVEFSTDHPSISLSDIRSPSNYSYYPWTLPPEYVPRDATCDMMGTRTTFDLSFPTLPEQPPVLGGLQRVAGGVLINSMSGQRFGMIKEVDRTAMQDSSGDYFRIYAISNIALGRDEKVFIDRDLVAGFNPVDPYFSRIRDTNVVDIVIDVSNTVTPSVDLDVFDYDADMLPNITLPHITIDSSSPGDDNAGTDEPSVLSALLSNLHSILKETWTDPSPSAQNPTTPNSPHLTRHTLAATLPTGPGAAPLPDEESTPPLTTDHQTAVATTSGPSSPLSWTRIHVLDSDLCSTQLPASLARTTQVLVVRRGGCSFSAKLANIASFAHAPSALQLVVVVSALAEEDLAASGHVGDYGGSGGSEEQPPPPIQPYLHEIQRTPAGLPRPSPIPLVLVGGGDETMRLFRGVGAVVGGEDGHADVDVDVDVDVDQPVLAAKGVGFRRRWFFESLGVRIGNLVVL